MMKVINIEETPNPEALKFILDAPLLETGVRQFDRPEDGASDLLAGSLFVLGGIESVFYMGSFVTVSKLPTRGWNDLKPRIIKAIEANASPVKAAVLSDASSQPSNGQSDASGTQAELLVKINQVLEDNVMPALAADGGGLEVLDLHDHVLTIHYQGACGSCPSSTAGTMAAVQNLLQRMVDPRIQVVPG